MFAIDARELAHGDESIRRSRVCSSSAASTPAASTVRRGCARRTASILSSSTRRTRSSPASTSASIATGASRTSRSQARLATRVREALAGAPVLLLTATPIQNSLTELWGLVQYVEPTGTLLGDLGTFRAIFCAGDDRSLREGQDDELRRRVATVCQRTLRRQAQEFMNEPFRRRQAQLFRYTMTAAEHGALRRRHEVPARSVRLRVPRGAPPLARHRFPPAHGVVAARARGLAAQRRDAAANAS